MFKNVSENNNSYVVYSLWSFKLSINSFFVQKKKRRNFFQPTSFWGEHLAVVLNHFKQKKKKKKKGKLPFLNFNDYGSTVEGICQKWEGGGRGNSNSDDCGVGAAADADAADAAAAVFNVFSQLRVSLFVYIAVEFIISNS